MVRSVPGPWKRSASKRRSVRRAAAAFVSRKRVVPGGDRIGLVQAEHVRELVGQLRERLAVEVGVDLRRPGRRRVGDDRPVRGAVVDDRARLLQARQQVAAGACRVEVVEQPGCAAARDPEPGAALLAEGEDALGVPRRHELERVLRCVRDPGALDPGVEVERVDEGRAAPVGGRRDGADERRVCRLGLDEEQLAGLEVGAEVDGELGESTCQLVGGHGQAILYRTRTRPRGHACRDRPLPRVAGAVGRDPTGVPVGPRVLRPLARPPGDDARRGRRAGVLGVGGRARAAAGRGGSRRRRSRGSSPLRGR